MNLLSKCNTKTATKCCILDGQVFLIYLAQPVFPPDGIRWQDAETKYPVGQGSPKELEVCEIKYGFVPGSGETNSTRMRRRYRMVHGGMPQLWLVHYSRVAGPRKLYSIFQRFFLIKTHQLFLLLLLPNLSACTLSDR